MSRALLSDVCDTSQSDAGGLRGSGNREGGKEARRHAARDGPLRGARTAVGGNTESYERHWRRVVMRRLAVVLARTSSERPTEPARAPPPPPSPASGAWASCRWTREGTQYKFSQARPCNGPSSGDCERRGAGGGARKAQR
jgi:hypothetical protein